MRGCENPKECDSPKPDGGRWCVSCPRRRRAEAIAEVQSLLSVRTLSTRGTDQIGRPMLPGISIDFDDAMEYDDQ